MRFLVVGTGGVGGYFGGKLAQSGQDVWFLSRGKHLEVMRSSGLRVRATEESFTVPPGKMTDDVHAAGTPDVVLFCVKAYDTETAARQIAPVLGRNSIVISLQNGVDNEDRIRRCISAGTVWGGLAYIYATITSPGEVTETGGPKRILFGPLSEDPAAFVRAREIAAVTGNAGISAEARRDVLAMMWKKFVFITAAGGLTALTRLTLGEILGVAETRSLFVDAMRETETVAQASGIPIEADFLERTFETLKRFDNSTRSSLYYDLTHGKPLEVEALSGTVVRLGTLHGIPTPIHRVVYASLYPYHLLHVQHRGQPADTISTIGETSR